MLINKQYIVNVFREAMISNLYTQILLNKQMSKISVNFNNLRQEALGTRL